MAISLSRFPALYNDYLERAPYEARGKTRTARLLDYCIGPALRQTSQNILARLVATAVFPLFAGLDIIANLACALSCKSRTHACLQEAEKCFLGLIATPAGLISPDIVTRHFVPKSTETGTILAGGKYHSKRGIEQTPDTPKAVQALVKKAIRENKKVTISGAHYSQSKDTLPTKDDSICINMRKLDGVTVNPKAKTVCVQAGATWGNVQEAANKHGMAVKVMQASNVFSIGGSLSVNCHGWDHRTGTVGETVKSLTIVDAKGKLQKLTPKDELFGKVLGGHGLFGVIVEAELTLCDNDALVSWGEKIAPEDYVEYFQKKILPDPNHMMHLYRLSLDPSNLLREGIAVSYSKRPMHALGVGNLVDEAEKGSRIDRIMVHIARSIPFTRALYWKIESSKIQNEQKQLRNEIMRPPINAAFNNSRADAEWLQEYFVPGHELAPFLKQLSKTLTDNEVALLNASVRYVKKDTISRLPYAKNEDMFAIVLFFNQVLAYEETEKTKNWVRKTIDDLIARGGTYYLPYQHFATKEQFDACYPDAKHLNHDANGLFDNGLAEDYLR